MLRLLYLLIREKDARLGLRARAGPFAAPALLFGYCVGCIIYSRSLKTRCHRVNAPYHLLPCLPLWHACVRACINLTNSSCFPNHGGAGHILLAQHLCTRTPALLGIHPPVVRPSVRPPGPWGHVGIPSQRSRPNPRPR